MDGGRYIVRVDEERFLQCRDGVLGMSERVVVQSKLQRGMSVGAFVREKERKTDLDPNIGIVFVFDFTLLNSTFRFVDLA